MIVMMPQKARTAYSILMYECYASIVLCLLCYYRYEASVLCQPKARAVGGKIDVHDVQQTQVKRYVAKLLIIIL